MGFVHPVHEGMLKDLGAGTRRARQCIRGHHGVSDVTAECVRCRRHAPRAVTGGLGNPRRPPGRARGRQIPDGNNDAAALRFSETASLRRRNAQGWTRHVIPLRGTRRRLGPAGRILRSSLGCGGFRCGGLFSGEGAASVAAGSMRAASAGAAARSLPASPPGEPLSCHRGQAGGRNCRPVRAERRPALLDKNARGDCVALR